MNGEIVEETVGGRRGRGSPRTWTVTLRLPEDWEAIFYKLIAAQDSPYETITDIIRHGFTLIMETWEDELKSSHMAAAFASERMIRNFVDEEAAYQGLKDNMEAVKALVNKLRVDGQDEKADEIVTRFKATVAALPDDYYRERYQEELVRWEE